MEALNAEFFKTVDWDPATGGPTPRKMAELGIDHFSLKQQIPENAKAL
jgi:hypothetical protein